MKNRKWPQIYTQTHFVLKYASLIYNMYAIKNYPSNFKVLLIGTSQKHQKISNKVHINSSIVQILNFMPSFASFTTNFRVKTIFNHDHECSMQETFIKRMLMKNLHGKIMLPVLKQQIDHFWCTLDSRTVILKMNKSHESF